MSTDNIKHFNVHHLVCACSAILALATSKALAASSSDQQGNFWLLGATVIATVSIGMLVYSIIMARNYKDRCAVLEEEMINLRVGLEQAQKKFEETEVKRLDPKARASRVSLGRIAGESVPIGQNSSSSRHSSKKLSPSSTSGLCKNDVSGIDVALEESTTVLHTPPTTPHRDKQQELAIMLTSYRTMVDHAHADDIRNFCQQYNVFTVQRDRNDSKNESLLEFVADSTYGDSELWALGVDEDAIYILPGALVRITFKSLNSTNAHLIKEIMQGVMLVVPSNKFELLEPGVAKKQGEKLVMLKAGKLGLPMETSKR